jgi:hypothetical protein
MHINEYRIPYNGKIVYEHTEAFFCDSKLRVLHLLRRHSTTRAMSTALVLLQFFFWIGAHVFVLGQPQIVIHLTSTSSVAGITSMCDNAWSLWFSKI